MFKKTKGVVLDSTTPYGIGVREDAKARLKYQTLVQDFVELQKEADVIRTKLEASKQRKVMLAAEVRFLRRRHKLLVKMRNTNSFKEQSPLQALGESSSLISTRVFDRNPNATLRNPAAAFDLNQDVSPGEREASFPTRARIFDLNEISTGDEDLQVNAEANKLEEAWRSSMRGMNEEQHDLKLSVCRNAGESSSSAGKRKISWQDPVALRV